MKNSISYVGLDAHKKVIVVAMLLPGKEEPIVWQLPNEAGAVRRMAKRILREAPGPVKACYEAGPCGYALQRVLKDLGVDCVVIAPSLIPVKPETGSRRTSGTPGSWPFSYARDSSPKSTPRRRRKKPFGTSPGAGRMPGKTSRGRDIAWERCC